MANPQKENGHTGIANELLEKVYQTPFTLRELRIILAVIRFTYGYSRKEAELSLRFLEQATRMPLRHVQSTIKKLICKNVLIIMTNFRGIHSRKIQFNKNYDNWKFSVDQTSNTMTDVSVTNSVNSSVTDSVNDSIDQSSQPIKKTKKKIKKKTNSVPSIPDELRQVEGFLKIWTDWIEFRKEIKKPLTPTSVRLQLNKLIEFKVKSYDVVKIIETSIERRWQGFFEPREFGLSYRNNGHKEAHLDDF